MLLILAAISIATLTGENGILSKASDAKEKTVQEEEKEQIKLAYNASKTEKLGNGNTSVVVANELQKELDNQNAGAEAVDEGNKIKVTFTKSENTYIINSVGSVKDEKEVKEKTIQFEIDGRHFMLLRGILG